MKYLTVNCGFDIFSSQDLRFTGDEYKADPVKGQVQKSLHDFPGLFPTLTFCSHSSFISEINPFLLVCGHGLIDFEPVGDVDGGWWRGQTEEET